MEFLFKPIGFVENDVHPFEDVNWGEVESRIRVLDEFADGLFGLDDYNYLEVFFLFHLSSWSSDHLYVHPHGRADLPLVGGFSTHSPVRPNPIGFSIVKLVSCEGNVLHVLGLDAYDGTPILDLKPFSYRPSWLRLVADSIRLRDWF